MVTDSSPDNKFSSLSRFTTKAIQNLQPYTPGAQPKRVLPSEESLIQPSCLKLNTNENPYPPSPKVPTAILENLLFQASSLRLYPDPTSMSLREVIAHREGMPGPEYVFVGNGSDEVLAFAFLSLLKQDRPLFFADITYSFYQSYCALFDICYQTIPLQEDFRIALSEYPDNAGAILIANPNAPTGISLTRLEIGNLATRCHDSIVLIDEAYVEFGAESASYLVSQYDNLLVVRTLSKSHSLAGMRIGYALGQPSLIKILNSVKDSFNAYPLDRLATSAAIAALQDNSWFWETQKKIMESRLWLSKKLVSIGWKVLPSDANFIFARHPSRAGHLIQSDLDCKQIMIRRFNSPDRIKDWLRITIGTSGQCEQLFEALREVSSS